MKTMIEQYKYLKKHAWSGRWSQRILSELYYLIELSRTRENRGRELLEAVTADLVSAVEQNGAITRSDALEAEQKLESLIPMAKSLEVILAGHAHIDMNWMWGYQETVSVTLDTFRTMLELMEEYPDFTFSQSQASTYRIVEEYAPQMLPAIRRRVKEGRWEVNASSWVENDRNMTGSESMARQILYSREYLSRLLELPEEEFTLDFEPDTFGHNENVPEMLTQGGIRWYYHCRGYDGDYIYRWRAPSGAELLVYREPMWYNDTESRGDCLGFVPEICSRYGISKALKLFGVGDHGGGPTRREIDNWLEIQTWPLMPKITFGSVKQFFRHLETVRESLPVVQQELNYVFTGCYTSQSCIKRSNRLGEDRLYESELLDAAARTLVPDYQGPQNFDKAWKNVLFNQFHDILPGSGVPETTQHALGQFQNAMAISQVNQKQALLALCGAMDTSAFGTGDKAQGGGVGMGTAQQMGCFASYAANGGGNRRLYTVFNLTPYARTETVQLVVWDWQGGAIRVLDSQGRKVPSQVLREGTQFWGHQYHHVLAQVTVPALGCSTYVLEEEEEEHFGNDWGRFFPEASPALAPRVDRITDDVIVLENSRLRAEFSPNTMKLLSLTDLETGKKLTGSAGFRLLTEDARQGMSAWRVGSYTNILDINESCPVQILSRKSGPMAQEVTYAVSFGASHLEVTVRLDRDSPMLIFDLKVDWHELGSSQNGVPQLNFQVPVAYPVPAYLCNVPLGMKIRKPLAQDVPCTGFMAALGSEKAVTLMSDCKYGFRGWEDSLAVSLLRGSYDPDPAPDQGMHTIRLALCVAEADRETQARCYESFVHPLLGFNSLFHAGSLPCEGSWLELSDGVRLQAVKTAQDGRGLILRLQNLRDGENEVTIRTAVPLEGAELTDPTETMAQPLAADPVTFQMGGRTVRSLRLIPANREERNR